MPLLWPDPYTGVAIYLTSASACSSTNLSCWVIYGGTSAAAPIIAGEGTTLCHGSRKADAAVGTVGCPALPRKERVTRRARATCMGGTSAWEIVGGMSARVWP